MFDVESHICYDAYLLVITSGQERITTRRASHSQGVRFEVGDVQFYSFSASEAVSSNVEFGAKHRLKRTQRPREIRRTHTN